MIIPQSAANRQGKNKIQSRLCSVSGAANRRGRAEPKWTRVTADGQQGGSGLDLPPRPPMLVIGLFSLMFLCTKRRWQIKTVKASSFPAYSTDKRVGTLCSFFPTLDLRCTQLGNCMCQFTVHCHYCPSQVTSPGCFMLFYLSIASSRSP